LLFIHMVIPLNYNVSDETVPLRVPLDTLFLESYCDQTLSAVNRLNGWVETL